MEDIIVEFNDCKYKLNSYIHDCFYNLKNKIVSDEDIKNIINDFYETFIKVDNPIEIIEYGERLF